MLGTIVGAGVYALPAMFKLTGIFAGSVVFWFLACIVLATHLLYADIALRRGEISGRKFPGHAEILLGPWAGYLARIVHPLLLAGVCFAYLLLGGDFLATLSRHVGGPGSVLLWQTLFWITGAFVVFFGLKFVARVESWLTSAFIVVFFFVLSLFVMNAKVSLFATANWNHIFVPFGTFLFSLSAHSVVPDVVLICGRNRKRSLMAVTIGSFGAALLIWLFGVLGYAAVGPTLSTNPSDVVRAFPASLFWLLPAVGSLSVAISFMALMQDLRDELHVEFHLSKVVSWIVALGSPLILLFVTVRNFLATVSFIGGIFGAIIGILISLMALKAHKKVSPIVQSISWFCAAIFFLAFVWSILTV